MKLPRTSMVCLTLILLLPRLSWGQPELYLGASSGLSGGTPTDAQIALVNGAGAGITAVAIDIGYDAAQLMNPVAAIGPSGSSAGKLVLASSPAAGVFRVGIISLTNAGPIGDGVIAGVKFDVRPGADASHIVLSYTSSAANATGSPIALSGAVGSTTIAPMPLRLVGSGVTYFSRLPDACGAITVDNSEVQALRGAVPGAFVLKNNYHVTLKGGFNNGFGSNTDSYTNISGITAEQGCLTVERIIVQ